MTSRVPRRMRFLLCAVLVVAACAGHALPIQAPIAPGVPYAVAPPDEAKLGRYLRTQWRAGNLTDGYYAPLVIEGTLDAQAAQLVESLGGRYMQPVRVTPTDLGAVTAEHVEPGTPEARVLVMVPHRALAFLVAQPWIVSMNIATSYPGPALDPEVSRRIDATLMFAMMKLGPERPFSVGGLGRVGGCITDDELAGMRAIGALISTQIAAPSCSYTIFSFEVPIDQLVALASLPFIVTLEGNRPMEPEHTTIRSEPQPGSASGP